MGERTKTETVSIIGYNTNIKHVSDNFDMVRMRRPLDSEGSWAVETSGRACHLSDYMA